jgi:hypothetical protein
MFETGLPSSQVALVWSQPLGTVSESEYPEPGFTSLNVRVFESVPSESSSRSKLAGLRLSFLMIGRPPGSTRGETLSP